MENDKVNPEVVDDSKRRKAMRQGSGEFPMHPILDEIEEEERDKVNPPDSVMSAEERKLTLDMRDAAIQYTGTGPDWKGKVYAIGVVRKMLADFAGHMVLEDREARASHAPKDSAKLGKQLPKVSP